MSAKGKRKIWRTVQTARGKALRSPDGKLYYGTRQEVRDAALFPVRRDMLANALSTERYLRDHGTWTQEQYFESCAECRRDAIQSGVAAWKHGTCATIPNGVFVLLMAGARLVGRTEDEFFDELWEEEITAFLELAEVQTGKREIPLTRYERAALTASGFDFSKIAKADVVTQARERLHGLNQDSAAAVAACVASKPLGKRGNGRKAEKADLPTARKPARTFAPVEIGGVKLTGTDAAQTREQERDA